MPQLHHLVAAVAQVGPQGPFTLELLAVAAAAGLRTLVLAQPTVELEPQTRVLMAVQHKAQVALPGLVAAVVQVALA